MSGIQATRVVPALVLGLFLLVEPAYPQDTRTRSWVSVTGDDSEPVYSDGALQDLPGRRIGGTKAFLT
jgi:hypothetical protein